jgi:hypothetical protein
MCVIAPELVICVGAGLGIESFETTEAGYRRLLGMA